MKKNSRKPRPQERVIRAFYEMRLKFFEEDRPLYDYINERRALTRGMSFPAQVYMMLKFAAAQMSAHDLESMKGESRNG